MFLHFSVHIYNFDQGSVSVSDVPPSYSLADPCLTSVRLRVCVVLSTTCSLQQLQLILLFYKLGFDFSQLFLVVKHLRSCVGKWCTVTAQSQYIKELLESKFIREKFRNVSFPTCLFFSPRTTHLKVFPMLSSAVLNCTIVTIHIVLQCAVYDDLVDVHINVHFVH